MKREHSGWGACVFALTVAALAMTASAQQTGFVLFPKAPQLVLFPDLVQQGTPVADDAVFVHPVTDPYYHEDSFVSTDLRLWYALHQFSDNSVLKGGEAQVFAAQIRVAITDQLQLVAYKDGFTTLHPGLFRADGWNDVALGLKWEFLQDNRDQLYAAAGAGYQFPWGYSSTLQNKEEARAWLSLDKGFGKLHLGGTFNYFWATGEEGLYGTSDRLSADVHIDYRLTSWLSPVVEGNFYHVTAAHKGVLPIQGADYTNLGDGYGDDVVTVGVGLEVRPIKNVAVRGVWEKNVTHPADIFDSRVTVSAVITF